MINHPNRGNHTYTVEALVRRSDGQTRKIGWEYSGAGSGTACWAAWRKMRATHATPDTGEAFVSAALLRDGRAIERIGGHLVSDVPESCDTPLHTCDGLERSIREHAHGDGISEARFLSVDTRVLRWLINDARTLNQLITRVHHEAEG